MVYDDDTRAFELLSEAVGYMSGGKDNIDRFEGEAIFKLLRMTGSEEQKDTEWCSWTEGMLSVLELHEVEEWANDLRIWYQRPRSKGGSDPKDGGERPVEEESLEAPSTEEAVPEVIEVTVPSRTS